MFLVFLILGAKGYSTLVLCTFRFVISWHQHNLPGGVSWLEPWHDAGPTLDQCTRTWHMLVFLFLGSFVLLMYCDNVTAGFHVLLALANTTISIGSVPQSFTLKCPAENTSVSQVMGPARA
ncbi:hypothetical protein DFH08DRAFT_970012 [Mycena albidolilacea]|uniref:Uncharacterized protein n=1 Tax=Mycena albidolilacea TaxID=1033008 RepID=A0AAD6ZGW4_9AGAR|nr:hypothetical protein DFH08DRAFT_970012 [Mycena albidolilacea]